ncbi:hypothetical protein Tco_0497432 [Tanacetum coccineum]
MAGLLCNKFKGGKDKVMLVLDIRVMLLVLKEIMQEDRQGWLNVIIVKVKVTWLGNVLNQRGLGTLHDPGILNGQVAQTTIPNTAAFQTEDLDPYDSDCDDVSNAKAVLMANLSNYGLDVISEVRYFEPYHIDMDNQSMHAMQGFEQTLVADFTNNEITIDSNIIPYSQYLQETQHEVVQDIDLYAQQDSIILSMIEQMSEQMFNDVNNWEKANQEKNNESLTAELESVRSSQHAASPVIDDEETLILEELNRLSEDFGKRFVPQQELSDEQAFWLQTSHPNTDQYTSSPVKFEAPRELPKITPDAIKEGNEVFGFDAELLNKQNTYNDLSKSYSQLEKNCIYLELTMKLNQEIFQKDSLSNNQSALEIREYFENNDLKAQLQAKDATICKLKEHIKSMRENDKEEKVKHEMDKIKTINIELEHSVAKLLSKNERLYKEIEHLKKFYKDQFDSIKRTHALSKEHGDSLIAQLNSKSMENADLKRQIQDKVLVITSLKNDLRKLKGKEIVENVAQIPIATTIAPGMFKIDLDPFAPKLLKNREAHIDYLKHTQEQAEILRGIVKQAKAK